MELTFEAVTGTNKKDYKDCIFPQIFAGLNSPVQEDGTILCIGARDAAAQKACGALTAMLKNSGDIEILCIFVDISCRRQGIGRDLFHYLLKAARASFTGEFKDGKTVIEININYSLPEDEIKDFESFLKHTGFTDFYEENILYQLGLDGLSRSRLLKGQSEKAGNMRLVTFGEYREQDHDDYDNMTALLCGGNVPDEELSMFADCDGDSEPAGYLIAHRELKDTLVISVLTAVSDDKTRKLPIEARLLTECIRKLENDNKIKTIMVSAADHETDRFFRGIMGGKDIRNMCNDACCNCEFTE